MHFVGILVFTNTNVNTYTHTMNIREEKKNIKKNIKEYITCK